MLHLKLQAKDKQRTTRVSLSLCVCVCLCVCFYTYTVYCYCLAGLAAQFCLHSGSPFPLPPPLLHTKQKLFCQAGLVFLYFAPSVFVVLFCLLFVRPELAHLDTVPQASARGCHIERVLYKGKVWWGGATHYEAILLQHVA